MSLYATPDELVTKWGRVEMTRLTAEDKLRDEAPDIDKMAGALVEASGIADDYLRKRYALPLRAPFPASLVLNVMHLARYQLSLGGDRTPSTQVKDARDGAVSWLKQVAEGGVLLDLPAAGAATGGAGGVAARFSDRERVIPSGGRLGW